MLEKNTKKKKQINSKKIMKKGTHGKDEKTFEELSYSDQAKTLNAQIQIIEKGLNAHFRKGNDQNKNIVSSKEKYIKQLMKLINNLDKPFSK